MLLLDALAEARIVEAMERGEFDDLAGAGKPLQLDDDSHIPETQRMACRILKNAGCLPPEMQLRKDIDVLAAAIPEIEDDTECRRARRRLQVLMLRLSLNRGGGGDLRCEQAYFDRIQLRWTRSRATR